MEFLIFIALIFISLILYDIGYEIGHEIEKLVDILEKIKRGY